jgi:hypothetical protein
MGEVERLGLGAQIISGELVFIAPEGSSHYARFTG